jgi:hypothetical protein
MMALLLTGTASSPVKAQYSNNPNNSSYPESSQPDAVPNEPDHVYGNATSTYSLPSGISPKSNGLYYSSSAPPKSDDAPAVPGSTDTTGSRDSGNTGTVNPGALPGGEEKR